MEGKFNTQSQGILGKITRIGNRLIREKQYRRQAERSARQLTPGENRILFSMSEILRLICGTHESNPK